MRWSKLFALSLAILLAGCVNLAAVRDFSKVSADSASFTNIVDEYARSADTRIAYLYPTLRDQGEEARLQKEKEARAIQAKKLVNVLKAVSAYMSALGDLAADKAADPTENIDKLVNELDSAKLIDPKLSKPASAVASLVGKIILDGYRQKELRMVINEANLSAPIEY